MPTYQTPGVFYERSDAVAPAISALRTDIAGFVGIAERGPIGIALPVESWRQFTAQFGGFIGSGFLAFAVRAFFENGGRRCWVVRVASGEPLCEAEPAGLIVNDTSGNPVWRIRASSPGQWGNKLSITIKETHHQQTRTEPGGAASEYSAVKSIGSFTRGTLVRLSQSAKPASWKVISDIDPQGNRLVWVNARPEYRLDYDSPLQGFDLNKPIMVESVEYTLIVRQVDRLVAVYDGLCLVPEHERYGPAILRNEQIEYGSGTPAKMPNAPQPVIVEELRPPKESNTNPPTLLYPLELTATTRLTAVDDSVHLRLASYTEVATGTILELRDPVNSAVICSELRVALLEPGSDGRVSMESPGLTVEQRSAALNAISNLNPLIVRVCNSDSRTEQLTGGSDGLALLRPDDFIGQEPLTSDSEKVRKVKVRGIKALESVDEISIVAVPDIHLRPIVIRKKFEPPICNPDPCLQITYIPPASAGQVAETELPPVFSDEDIYRVQAALVQHCADRRDRIALLEPPYTAVNDTMLGVPAVRAWRSRFESKYAAFYYPWVRVLDPLSSGDSLTRDIPPCGHIAGQFARNDIEFGVHRAPANMPMAWVQDLTVLADDSVHGLLNPIGINVIRSLQGRGIRILGARTVSSDPGWRYVNVRRLLMMIEKAIGYAMQWAVFEPNNVYTRFKINLSLTSFLMALWQRGALAGKSKEEAFYVKCDEENNPQTDRDNGKLLAEIGIAPSLPWEFVVVRVGRINDEIEMSEYSVRGGT